MSLGWTTNFKVFEPKMTLGKREGYYHGRQSLSLSGFRGHQCAGGEPSNQGQTNNTMPALAAGSMKKLLMSAYVDGGGRLDCYSRVNAAVTLQGLISSVGKVQIDFDDPFVKGDLINWQFQRNNSNGTFDFGAFMEIEWDEVLDNIQHWYGGLYRTGNGLADGYFEIGEMTMHAIFPLTPRTEFQTPMQKGGKILDYGFYGASPVGVDTIPEFRVEINGADVDNFVLGQSASRVFYDKVGADISFSAGDLINLAGHSANNAAVLEGIPTMRIQFD